MDIKNHTFHHFDDVMRVIDIDFDNILLDEKSYKSYGNFWFEKIGGFIKWN